MRTAFLLYVLCLVILISMVAGAARAQEEDEPARARVVCDGARVAIIQILAPRAGVYTFEMPRDVCGRSA
jgi:hypothetical protein